MVKQQTEEENVEEKKKTCKTAGATARDRPEDGARPCCGYYFILFYFMPAAGTPGRGYARHACVGGMLLIKVDNNNEMDDQETHR
jgi:hypothetical protein